MTGYGEAHHPSDSLSLAIQVLARNNRYLKISLLAPEPNKPPEPGYWTFNPEVDWPIFEGVLEQALTKLQTMRQEEGRAMAQELMQYRDQIAAQLASIRERSPGVVAAYRDRLHDRVRNLLAEL